MKPFLALLICALFIRSSLQDRVEVVIPTAAQEAEYLWRTLQDLPTLDRFQYDVVWPAGNIMEELKSKARNGTLSPDDYEALLLHIKTSVYSLNDYQSGAELVRRQKGLLNEMVDQLNALELNWDFKMFGQYRVVLTLYGPGGSYDPENGSILLFTDVEGNFKQYANPAYTIIHEIVHMGIEQSIVMAYNVPHPMKERVVDKFVILNFQDRLPQYRAQNMGDYRIDPFLKERDDLAHLDGSVEKALMN